MANKVIRMVKPFLIQDGQPTALVKTLHKTESGRNLIKAMFAYYADNQNFKQQVTVPLDDKINIEDYRVESTIVDRLRKVGL
jgi:hypothetical protein